MKSGSAAPLLILQRDSEKLREIDLEQTADEGCLLIVFTTRVVIAFGMGPMCSGLRDELWRRIN